MPHRPANTHSLPPSMLHVSPAPISLVYTFLPFLVSFGGDLVSWLPCPRSSRLYGFSTAVLYIMYHTVEGWGALFSLYRIFLVKHTTVWVYITHQTPVKIHLFKLFFSPQNGGTEGEKDDDGKKSKRRPRPEPLFIPPPKPGLFIAPPVYSTITPYQSHLRSPVRLADNPLTMPPYTPPPILSPVREGSGLYFSTFLSSAAASSQGLPPPATPKSATRSLLRSSKF